MESRADWLELLRPPIDDSELHAFFDEQNCNRTRHVFEPLPVFRLECFPLMPNSVPAFVFFSIALILRFAKRNAKPS